jgi:hypothetical protein
MSVRPVFLRDIKRSAIQTHQQQVGHGSYNRYSPLAPRDRAFSYGKRQLSGSGSAEAAAKTPRLDRKSVFERVKGQEIIIAELKKSVTAMEHNPDLPDHVTGIWKAIGMVVNLHEGLLSAVIDMDAENGKKPAPMPAPTIVLGGAGTGTGNAFAKAPPKKGGVAMDAPEASAESKMRQTLRDAEKKLVLFNMNLGKAPVMNRDTLARSVAVELGNKVKEGKHDYHIGDAEDVIDDVLSCSKLEFMGTSTRKFFNNKKVDDPRNNVMYTMPVRMEFKDRDVRFQSELSLRKICKVNCSVPYPKNVRVIIDELIKEGKRIRPNSFIRTRVNIDKLTIEAHASVDKKWVDLGLTKNIMPGPADEVFVPDSQPQSQTGTDNGSDMDLECGASQTVS